MSRWLSAVAASAALVSLGFGGLAGCATDDISRAPDGQGGAAGNVTTGGQGIGGSIPPTCAPPSEPSGFFAAPDGSASGDGSLGAPWDLATALAGPAAVVPGSTLWLRGGRYGGAFVSSLTGTAAAPIVVRSYPGELATIDGAGFGDVTLSLNGGYTWFWGLEITNSGGNHSYGDRPNGLDVNGKFLKIINCYVHDGGGNFMYAPMDDPDWDSEGLELYGSFFYLQGVNPQDASDRAHGHAIYSQNFQTKKQILENLVFNGFSWGIHCYAENPARYVIKGFDFIGNVTFNTNAAESGPIVAGNDFLVGGDSGVFGQDILLHENFSWAHGPSHSVKLGYGTTQNQNITVTDNHFAGGFELGLWTSVSMTGNTIYGGYDGFDAATYPDNTFVASPQGVEVFVRPNQYEPGRGHVIVYNWDGVDTVDADLSTVLVSGSSYQIRNAQAPLSAPLVEGIYDGQPVTLPLADLHPQQPVGLPDAILPEDETGKTFNVFLVIGCY